MSKKFVDYYSVLGVRRNASNREIRAAYGKKVRQYKLTKSEENFELLAKAYEVLSDEDERTLFDMELGYYELDMGMDISAMGRYLRAREEIKEIEKKNNFTKRHAKASAYLREKNGDNDSVGIKIKNGTLHVAGEFYHQLSKLGRIGKEDWPKYVARNRKIFAGMILAGGLFVGIKAIPKGKDVTPVQPQPTSKHEIIRIDRRVEVDYDDVLSDISNEYGVSLSFIQGVNPGTRGNSVGECEVIYVPYNIEEENLFNHMMTVPTEGLSIDEIARKYETNRHTLMELNGDALYYDYDEQVLKTDLKTIKVPIFPEIKTESKEESYQYKMI